MSRYINISLIFLITLTGLPLALAWNAQVNFSGTLVRPPSCIINNDTPIDLDFGDNLLTTRIDGVHYRQRLNWTLVCSDNPSNSMHLRITGSGASFDATALATNVHGLGIRFSQGAANTTLNLNDWLDFTYPTLPVLTAIPVKDPSVKLSGGTFTAGATLITEFL